MTPSDQLSAIRERMAIFREISRHFDQAAKPRKRLTEDERADAKDERFLGWVDREDEREQSE